MTAPQKVLFCAMLKPPSFSVKNPIGLEANQLAIYKVW